MKMVLIAVLSALGAGCAEGPPHGPAAEAPANVNAQSLTSEPETDTPQPVSEDIASEESANSDEGEDIDTSVLLRVLNQGERAEPVSSESAP
jgi:hypothetical protein